MAAAYDDSNVFALILRGELPSVRVYEDEMTVALMDIMPRADGHVLVIPKAPVRTLLDAAPEQLDACIRTTQRLAHAVVRAFDADGVGLIQANEAAAGQEVFHLHFHVLPRHQGVKLRPPASEMATPETLAAHAEKIRAALAAG